MFPDMTSRLRSLLRRKTVEHELDEELRFHLDQQIERHVRQGLSRAEATRRATIEFGGLDQIREEHRDARGVTGVTHLARDLRHALTQLRRAPAFSALAVLCLGLGIGVNTSIFGVLNAVMFRLMPVADPERLIVVSRGADGNFSYPAYRAFGERNHTLSGLTATMPSESDLEVGGESQFVAQEAVDGNYARVIGVPSVLGRWFTDDREPAAVISYTVWERRFNRDPSVIGRRIGSESQSYTIVGVAPAEYAGIFAPVRTDLWVPIMTRPAVASLLNDASVRRVMLFGRLGADATEAQASAELNAIDAQLDTEHGRRSEAALPINVEPIRGLSNRAGRRTARLVATFLQAVVWLVLLIACVNVGNLLLVRGAVRQREFGVRRALGASRGRLLQQLIAESLVMAMLGGLCGLVLARWTTALLQRSLPLIQGFFQAQLDFSLDWRVIAYATLVSLATTVLCGLLPAWRASQTDALVAFKGEIVVGRLRRRPIGVVAQVAMSFVLLIVCGTFIEGLLRMQSADPGFAIAGRMYAFSYIASPDVSPHDKRRIYANAIDQLRALPGVRSATISDSLPLMANGNECVSIDKGTRRSAIAYAVQAGYFTTMNIGIVAGRDFSARDDAAEGSGVIVNEQLARTLWPNKAAVGEQMLIGCRTEATATVIGVAHNAAVRSLGETPRPQIYLSFGRQYEGGLTAILLDTSTPPAGLVETVRRTLLELGQGIRVYTVQPLSAHVEKSYAYIRWQSSVLNAFGLLALLLAAVGLYGVIALRVALRTREIGVRMALGAGRPNVFREVVGQGLSLAVIGVIIGEVLAIGIGRLLSSADALDAEIQPPGLLVLAATGVIWIVVAAIAAYVPAARASSVNPLTALRYE